MAMIKMNEEELDSIQELIERKLLMAEVMGGLTSQDKKFINLWNYAMQLQNNWNELNKFVEEKMSVYEHKEASNFYVVFEKMQELENGKDDFI